MSARIGPLRLAVAAAALAAAPPPAAAQITWQFDYQDEEAGFADPAAGAGRRAAVRAAADYLSRQFDGRGRVRFAWEPSEADGTGAVATAGTRFDFANGFQTGYVYRGATTGGSPSLVDGSGRFDFGGAFAGFDVQAVALHELVHAMGFLPRVGEFGEGGSGTVPAGGPDRYGQPARYLRLGPAPDAPRVVLDNAAFNAAAIPDPRAATAANNLYFHGPIATAANGGSPIKLFAPTDYVDGTSLLHVDPAWAAANGSAAVLLPTVAAGTATRALAAYEVGMLIDIGWNQYAWAGDTGRWAEAVAAPTGRWQNFEGVASRSPVGTITPNLVLTFPAGGYVSTNDLDLAAAGDRFLVNRLVLTGDAGGTAVVAAAGDRVLRFGTDIGVRPQIAQQGGGRFDIRHPAELTAPGVELTGDGGGVVTVSGVVAGAGRVAKTGASEFRLAAANTYAGGTAVAGGTLRATNTAGSATGPGAVTVAAGGTLGGALGLPAGAAGFVAGAVTVEAGGTVRPGAAGASEAGQLTFRGPLTFAADGRYAWGLAALTDDPAQAGLGFDVLRVEDGGGLSLAGGVVELTVAAADVGAAFWQTARQWTILDVLAGQTSGQFREVRYDPGFAAVGRFALLSGLGGDVVLVFSPLAPVPEPAGLLAAAAAAAGVWAGRRGRNDRRKRKSD